MDLGAFVGARVLVVGETVLHIRFEGDSPAVSGSAGCPELQVRICRRSLGGAGSAAARVASVAKETHLLTSVGPDENGTTVTELVEHSNVRLHAIASSEPTPTRIRIVDRMGAILCLDCSDHGAASHLNTHEARLMAVCRELTKREHFDGYVICASGANEAYRRLEEYLTNERSGTETPVYVDRGAPAADPVSDDAGLFRARSADEKMITRPHLLEIVRIARRRRLRVVFTNGCFDILHRGHIRLLEQARGLGDILVVAVNGDRSVRGLKGNGRPFLSVQDRMEVLARLWCIDFLVSFDEPTPVDLIKAVRPDVLIKGGDYTPDRVVGHEYAGRVVIGTFTSGCSTTAIASTIAGCLR